MRGTNPKQRIKLSADKGFNIPTGIGYSAPISASSVSSGFSTIIM